jgi:UDP-N-acetyl-D-mannosaminuronic acid dehydrogenase
MAVSFASVGHKVYAVDSRREIVDQINSGMDPIGEPGLQELIADSISSGKLEATTDLLLALQQSDAVLISVPTPVTVDRPDLAQLIDVIEKIGKSLSRNKAVIIISTVPVGTVNGLVRSTLEDRSGLRSEQDFCLAYAPERIAPGNALREFREHTRLVGGVGPKSTAIAADLFGRTCRKVVATDVMAAEVSKLAENTFRDVNIAFANELALICEKLGCDAKRIIELANTHPRVGIHMPGGGVGGPCLPKDPWLLLSSERLRGWSPKLIPAARAVNDSMPNHVVSLAERGLRKTGREMRGAAVSVLGTAYKGGNGDTRYSPSAAVIRNLIDLQCIVIAFDPYTTETFAAGRASSLEDALVGSDCIVLMTDHPEFKLMGLDRCKQLMSDRPVLIDAKRIVDPEAAKRLGFAYFAIGYDISDPE